MLKSYFTIAWRILWKNRLFSGISIGGLAIGIASSILLLGYVSFQFSYDRFHSNRQNLYRVDLDLSENNRSVFRSAENYAAVGPALKKDYPEVIEAARLYNMGYKNNCVFTYNNTHFRERKFLYAESSFLNMFSFPFLKGDPKTALAQPYTAVVSASTAKSLFGDQPAIGKFLQMNDDDRNAELCKITGVFKDIPENSHIKFNILISYSTLFNRRDGLKRYEAAWENKDFYTYVLLRPGAHPKSLESKFPAFITRHIPEEHINHKESRLILQPINEIHLSSNLIDEPEATGNKKAVLFMIFIALFTITIAWVNYINLATAGSINRSKEIGIRKVLGSRRSQLIKQFLTESLIINMVSFSIGMVLVYLLKPVIGSSFHSGLSLSIFSENTYGLLFIGFLSAGTFFSGLYPALVLSSLKPISILKGKIRMPKNGLSLRKSLVVFQFSLSILLIIGTFIVYQQVHFMLKQDLGLKVGQVLVLDRPGRWDSSRTAHSRYVEGFKEALSRDPAIESIGMADELPGKEIRYPGNYSINNQKDEHPIPINTIGIDQDYLHTLGIKILSGRNFSKNFKTDKRGLILTESAAVQLGFSKPGDAPGKQVFYENEPYTVIGVVNDFHQLSLQKKETSAIFQFTDDAREFEYYLVKVKTANIHHAIDQIQKEWNNAFEGNPFGFTFLDEYFNRQYKNEIQFGKLFGIFSIIAISIACVGLFALVAFMVEQRTKEIGVRKILGASIQDLVMLLTKDFIRLVILANVIAWPLGWSLMNNWLQDFAYRVNISWLVFAFAGATAVIIALITISFQAIKAALANPVKNLRAD